MGSQQTLEEVFGLARKFADVSGICPHCGVLAGFIPVTESGFHGRFFGQQGVATNCHMLLAKCRSCQGGVFGILENDQAALLWPTQGWPDKSPADLAEAFKADYDEARAVLPFSAKAAAVLTRRCVQAVLRHKIGVSKSSFYNEIEEASKSELLSKPTGDALHHVPFSARADVGVLFLSCRYRRAPLLHDLDLHRHEAGR